jgi:hypothetical protein
MGLFGLGKKQPAIVRRRPHGKKTWLESQKASSAPLQLLISLNIIFLPCDFLKALEANQERDPSDTYYKI